MTTVVAETPHDWLDPHPTPVRAIVILAIIAVAIVLAALVALMMFVCVTYLYAANIFNHYNPNNMSEGEYPP